MNKVIQMAKKGLSSNQIKWIALFFMTIDHLAAFGFEIPLFAAHSDLLRLLGRIAAPLFLYMITESARHTRSRSKLIKRLYLAGVFVGLFTTVTNLLLGEVIGIFSPGNIIFTFFYTVLYIHLIEGIIEACKEKNTKRIALFSFAVVGTCIPHFLYQVLFNSHFVQPAYEYIILYGDLVNSFIPSPLHIEYSPMFVIMGIALYFAKTRKFQCIVFALFCVLSFGGSVQSVFMDLWPFNDFFMGNQYCMVLALPIMMLYNGKRGKEQKLFFYAYYPLHRYAISIVQAFLS